MLLAYYEYCSIISIVIILAVMVFIVIGFRKGFLTKFISMANSLCGFVFSLLFCRQFSNIFTYKIWGASLADKFKENFMAKNPELQTGEDVLKALGLPSFITKNVDISLEPVKIYSSVANTCSKLICAVISFFILFIGISVLCFLLKLLVAACRQSRFIRFLDGLLGVVFYLILTYLGVCLVLFVLTFVMQANSFNGFQQWIINDLQLQSSKWRISKFMYENNIIGNFFNMFF